MLVKLDDRLKAVADLVLPGKTAADIGTDHNYLPVFLVQNNICEQVIASDRADGPYRNAASLVKRLALEDKIKVRLGEGLEVLNPGEAATIIIAGMGGRLMIDILAAAPAILTAADRLVLQPQKDLPAVRCWLADHRWSIVKETMALDSGIYYTALAAEHGQMKLSQDEIDFGPCLIAEHPQLWIDYLQLRLEDIEQLVGKLAQHDSGEIRRRQQSLQQERKRIIDLLARATVDDK